MSQIYSAQNRTTRILIKFIAPLELKVALDGLARERNITLSSLLRLISSEYLKRNEPV
jgi:hypothetical protein